MSEPANNVPFGSAKAPRTDNIIDWLKRAVGRAERSEASIALFLVDVDEMCAINARFGRAAGDTVLASVAERLRSSAPERDLEVMRLEGDAFAVVGRLLNGRQDAERLADTMLVHLSSPLSLPKGDVFVTATVGVAIYPDDAPSAAHLLQAADLAVHDIGKRPKNQIQFYSPSLSESIGDQFPMESDVRRAVERGELEVYYQPKVDTFTSSVVGAEALVRWNHPDKGLLSPACFIPVAEHSGLINRIGEWVATTACRDVRRWQRLGLPEIRLSINVSIRQFETLHFVDSLMETLVASNLDSEYLEVEVTESLFQRDPRQVLTVLERVRELGIGVSIDDFGTGYSSLSQLQKLPIDTLKIDRSFVEGVPKQKESLVIVEAITQLGRNLGLRLVAEGVESAEQLTFLQEIGCDQCQGYLFSRPLPAAQFEALLGAAHERTSVAALPEHDDPASARQVGS